MTKPNALQYLEAIASLNPEEAFWAVDANQNIVFWSEGAENLLGYSQEDVIGHHCSVAINCVRCSTGCGLMQFGVIKGKSLPHYTKEGQAAQLKKWAYALRDADGTFLGGVEILRQDQEQKQKPKINTGKLINFHNILTGDTSFMAMLTSLRHVAHTDVNVLIRGETGSGKEMVARAIHNMSPRAPMPFVAINCGTLSREFLASEIFGHKRGAFTGAHADKQGLLAKAEGGTLFLDEVAELPMDVQAMLLRVIQERRYTPLGDTRDRATDIRILSATHVALRDAVSEGSFREDLMYRLRVVPVFLPSLRERTGDIPLLWHHFLEKAATKMSVPVATSTEDVLQVLANYPWPGNIRELINLAEYVTVTRPGKDIRVEHLLPEYKAISPLTEVSDAVKPSFTKPARVGQKLNRDVIEAALASANGSTEDAARELGVSRITLWRWRKKLGLV